MARNNTRRLACVSWSVLTLCYACGGDEGLSPRVPADIVVTPNEPIIPQGHTRQLTAIVVDAAGQEIKGETVGYASSDSSIVTVSGAGLLTAVGPLGQATITVSDGDLTTRITAKVILPPSSVIVTPNPVVVNPTLSIQLSVMVTDGVGDPLPAPPISYVSNDPAVVTVSVQGVVYAPGALGSTTITVTSGNATTDVPVTVAQIPTTLTASPTSIVLAPGSDQQITATVLDAAGAQIPDAPVAYTSSRPAIFSVSGAGLVHAMGSSGSGSVTVRSGDLVAGVAVFVGTAPPGTILATVPMSPTPWGVTVTPGRKFYVTRPDGGVIGGTFPDFSFPFSAPTSGPTVGSTALQMAVNTAGTRGYVAAAQLDISSAPGIGILDLTNGTLLDVIPMDQTPLAVTLSPDESTLFVGSGAAIWIVDIAAKTVVKEMGVGTVNVITRHPSLPLLYASVNGGAQVLEIDANSRDITRTFPISGAVQGTAVSPDGAELYVALEYSDLVVWDLTTNHLKETVTGGGGFGLGLSPDGAFLYVAGLGNVRIYDRGSRTLLRTVNTGGDPRRIGFDPVTGTAIVSNAGGWVDFIK